MLNQTGKRSLCILDRPARITDEKTLRIKWSTLPRWGTRWRISLAIAVRILSRHTLSTDEEAATETLCAASRAGSAHRGEEGQSRPSLAAGL